MWYSMHIKLKNLEILNNTIIGSSWGIYLQTCVNTTINQNTIKNQSTTGILNFDLQKYNKK